MSEPNHNSAKPVRVLINAIHAKSGGGINYLRNILPRLATDAGLDIHILIHENQRDLLDGIDGRIQPCIRRFPAGFMASLIWEQFAVPSIARRLGAQVTFSPANFCPLFARRNIILLRNALAVGDHEPRLSKRIYWLVLGLMTRMSLAVSRRAIAASAYARDAIAGPATEGVEVVHYGVAEIFSPANGARDHDLLAVSDIYVQKNFHQLVRVLAQLRSEFPTLRLRIAGRAIDPDYDKTLKILIGDLGLTEAVEFLGGVTPEALVGLYRQCGLFVFPSTAETFGNPLVEAMACGAPIACSNTAAMPEIVADAAVQFDPLNVENMRATISSLLRDDDRRAALSGKSVSRAQQFSWDHTASETAKIFKAAAA